MKKPVSDALARVELYLLGVRNNVTDGDFRQALANCAELNGCVRRLYKAVVEAYKTELTRSANWSELDKLDGKTDEQREIL